jgi:hypothetical protein
VSAGESLDASLRRAAVRVRAWDWDGATARERGRLTLAGYHRSNALQWIGEDPSGDVLLRRGTRVDLLDVATAIDWKGEVLSGSQGEVGGSVLVVVPGQGAGIWMGPADRRLPAGELAWIEPRAEPLLGGDLFVERVEALASPSVLGLHLAWEPSGCPSAIVERSGDVRGTSVLVVAGRSATDTAAVGERVTYRLRAAPCAPRALEIVARIPGDPAVRWQTRGILGVDFGEPLAAPSRPAVEVRRGDTIFPPLAVESARAGRELRITLDGLADSVIVTGAWTADGLPAGGARRKGLAVPPRPPDSTVVVSQVAYRGSGAPILEVHLRGDAGAVDDCSPSFVLSPPGWDLTATAGGDPGRRRISLPGKLPAGAYTLRLGPGCAGAGSDGAARSFQVELAVYPNPVRGEANLVVENAPPGSRATLFDVAGKKVGSWSPDDVPQWEPPPEMAPGLYFLRLTDAQGGQISLRKVVVVK